MGPLETTGLYFLFKKHMTIRLALAYCISRPILQYAHDVHIKTKCVCVTRSMSFSGDRGHFGVVAGIDVKKNFFYVILFWSSFLRFLTLFIFQPFFYFQKRSQRSERQVD